MKKLIIIALVLIVGCKGSNKKEELELEIHENMGKHFYYMDMYISTRKNDYIDSAIFYLNVAEYIQHKLNVIDPSPAIPKKEYSRMSLPYLPYTNTWQEAAAAKNCKPYTLIITDSVGDTIKITHVDKDKPLNIGQ